MPVQGMTVDPSEIQRITVDPSEISPLPAPSPPSPVAKMLGAFGGVGEALQNFYTGLGPVQVSRALGADVKPLTAQQQADVLAANERLEQQRQGFIQGVRGTVGGLGSVLTDYGRAQAGDPAAQARQAALAHRLLDPYKRTAADVYTGLGPSIFTTETPEQQAASLAANQRLAQGNQVDLVPLVGPTFHQIIRDIQNKAPAELTGHLLRFGLDVGMLFAPEWAPAVLDSATGYLAAAGARGEVVPQVINGFVRGGIRAVPAATADVVRGATYGGTAGWATGIGHVPGAKLGALVGGVQGARRIVRGGIEEARAALAGEAAAGAGEAAAEAPAAGTAAAPGAGETAAEAAPGAAAQAPTETAAQAPPEPAAPAAPKGPWEDPSLRDAVSRTLAKGKPYDKLEPQEQATIRRFLGEPQERAAGETAPPPAGTVRRIELGLSPEEEEELRRIKAGAPAGVPPAPEAPALEVPDGTSPEVAAKVTPPEPGAPPTAKEAAEQYSREILKSWGTTPEEQAEQRTQRQAKTATTKESFAQAGHEAKVETLADFLFRNGIKARQVRSESGLANDDFWRQLATGQGAPTTPAGNPYTYEDMDLETRKDVGQRMQEKEAAARKAAKSQK